MNNNKKGMTLAETLIASALLATAVIPCLRAITASNTLTTTLERRTICLMLTRQKIEDIRAKAIYSYSGSFAVNSESIGDSYYCKVTDSTINSNLRRIRVYVGFDENKSNSLSDSEIKADLETLVARRWQ